MLPAIAIEDREMPVDLPPKVTAATGMDPLSHCLGAWCAPSSHPMTEDDFRQLNPGCIRGR